MIPSAGEPNPPISLPDEGCSVSQVCEDETIGQKMMCLTLRVVSTVGYTVMENSEFRGLRSVLNTRTSKENKMSQISPILACLRRTNPTQHHLACCVTARYISRVEYVTSILIGARQQPMSCIDIYMYKFNP